MHLAVKGRLFRLIHEVYLNVFKFDVDFYRPKAKLTLLHVVAKYVSYSEWSEEEQTQIKRLVERSNNLTLKNNMGSTILKCMKNVNASEVNQELM